MFSVTYQIPGSYPKVALVRNADGEAAAKLVAEDLRHFYPNMYILSVDEITLAESITYL